MLTSHLKAFILVFVISAIVLVFFQGPYARAIGKARAAQWRNLYLAVTAAAFLVPNYWLFLFAAAGSIFVLGRNETVKPALFLILLAAIPPFGTSIPGFAGINRFILVEPDTMLTLVILVPLMFMREKMAKLTRHGGLADFFFLSWVVLQVGLSFRSPSLTNDFRLVIENIIALVPIYYVFSRSLKSLDDMRVVSAAFILPILVIAATTPLEVATGWHFFLSIPQNWYPGFSMFYTTREGLLRASGATVHSIAWGYYAMCALGLALAFFNDKMKPFFRVAGFTLLAIGLVASLSRGPWLGMVVVLLVFTMTGPQVVIRSMRAGLAGLAGFAVLLVTPFGNKITNMLPGIGDGGSSSTIDYRRDLLNTGWEVIWKNPLFGAPDFRESADLASLRQGQGIVDVVNTYISVGLGNGVIGMVIFIGFFTAVASSLRGAMKAVQHINPTIHLYCRAYLATLIGILVTIFTSSSVGQIDEIYWFFGAAGIALTRIARHEVQSSKATVKADNVETASGAAYG